ncbi:amidohydrolase [Bacillus coreaensis]
MNKQTYWLINVILETGYIYEGERIVATKTDLHHLLIKDGKITKILSENEPITDDLPKVDANKRLALPPFAESHFHLDKSYIGGPWKAINPTKNLIERLDDEAKILPLQLPMVKSKAKLLIDRITKAGSTHIRTHVNIDPYVGLKHLESVREALEEYSDQLTYEIVAFPQHGLLRTNVASMMRQAMKEGATHVGGVDPGGVDGYVERSLETMVDIAVEAGADIDLHLHDLDYLGIYTMKKLCNLIEEAGWKNCVAISHGFALVGIPESEAAEMADRFVELGVSMKSTAAMQRMLPFPLLKRKGVGVALGCDSMFDSWGSFGNADILERVSRLAEYYRWSDERSLAETLAYITQGLIPLNEKGEQMWPKSGDDANMVLVDASCSAELIARRCPVAFTVHRGKMIDCQKSSIESSILV